MDMSRTRWRSAVRTIACAGAALALAAVVIVAAGPGDLDPAFNGGGTLTLNLNRTAPGLGLGDVHAVAVAPDGKIVVAGVGTSDTILRPSFMAVRLNADGTPDSTFGTGGVVLRNTGYDNQAANAVLLQPDGRVVIGGGEAGLFQGISTYDNRITVLIGLNADGTLDSNVGVREHDYGCGTGFIALGDGSIQFIGRQSDGQIVYVFNCVVGDGYVDDTQVVGRATPGGGSSRLHSFDNTTSLYVTAMTVQPDDKILVAGQDAHDLGTIDVYRLLADGTLDPAFGVSGRARTSIETAPGVPATFVEVDSLAVQPDGHVSVTAHNAGYNATGLAVVHYLPDGTLDAGFGAGGVAFTPIAGLYDDVRGAQAPNGKIVMVTPGPASTQWTVRQFNADGTPDAQFGTSGIVETQISDPDFGVGPLGAAGAVCSGSGLVVGGTFTIVHNESSDVALARYLDDCGSAAPAPNTPAGAGIQVPLGPVGVVFGQVTAAGDTTYSVATTGPAPPPGFAPGTEPTFYDLSTTATFTGGADVFFTFDTSLFKNPAAARLFHFENGQWVDVTAPLEPPNGLVLPLEPPHGIIAGHVTSFSPFAVFEPADTEPPAIAGVTPSVSMLWPANHLLRPVSLDVAVTDDTDPSPACAVTGVSSNEAANGTGDGNTEADWAITGPLAVLLRAERAGSGTGRIYTITVRCTDAAGHASTADTQVRVPHDRR